MPSVLVVDDDKIVIEHLIEWLVAPKQGCDVELASNVEDAEARLRQGHYDIVVVDIMIAAAKIIPGKSFGESAQDAKNAGVGICRLANERRREGAVKHIVVYTVLEGADLDGVYPYSRMCFTKGQDSDRMQAALRRLIEDVRGQEHRGGPRD